MVRRILHVDVQIVVCDGADGEAVPKIVDPGSACRGTRNDGAVMQKLVEDPVHGSIAQPFAARADQQGRHARRSGSVIAAQTGVERRDGRRVQRQGTRLVELGPPDRHHAAVRVEVIAVEGDCLADPHAGHRQKADQGPAGRLHMRSVQDRGRLHQCRNLLRRIGIGRCTPRLCGQKVGRRYLGPLVERAQVPGEEANLGQPS